NSAEYIGYSGAGTFSQTGGTNTINNDALVLGYNAFSSGLYTLAGSGALAITGASGNEIIGKDGLGTFIQTGGTHTISNGLYIGSGGSSSGVYTLSSGSLILQNAASIFGVGFFGAGVFNQSGGSISTALLTLGRDG